MRKKPWWPWWTTEIVWAIALLFVAWIISRKVGVSGFIGGGGLALALLGHVLFVESARFLKRDYYNARWVLQRKLRACLGTCRVLETDGRRTVLAAEPLENDRWGCTLTRLFMDEHRGMASLVREQYTFNSLGRLVSYGGCRYPIFAEDSSGLIARPEPYDIPRDQLDALFQRRLRSPLSAQKLGPHDATISELTQLLHDWQHAEPVIV